MRRLVVIAAALVALVLPAAAAAHPLGNFSINHLTEVRVEPDRVSVLYILDEAEIPTFQQRALSPAAVIARVRAEVSGRVIVTAGGRRVALRPDGRARLTHRPGQAGLPTTRVELPLAARTRALGTVSVHDGTYPGRVGWHAVVPRPAPGTAVRSDVPATDPTAGLRRYPRDLLRSPAAVRDARLIVSHGPGTVQAPHGPRVAVSSEQAGQGFTRLLADAAAGHGVLILLLLAAFGWGALHALSPGHGKTMVAAYLVGTRGGARDAVALGAIVTVTHTAGVVALGVVALLLSAWIVPEDIYPWLNLAAGLLVIVVGARVLRGRWGAARSQHHHHHHHHHDHHPARGSLLAMGASAGLVPCPSALVVLLGAVAQHQVALGLVLIGAFSAGLAATLTGLGLLVVTASRRLKPHARASAYASAASAGLILVVGAVLTGQAVTSL